MFLLNLALVLVLPWLCGGVLPLLAPWLLAAAVAGGVLVLCQSLQPRFATPFPWRLLPLMLGIGLACWQAVSWSRTWMTALSPAAVSAWDRVAGPQWPAAHSLSLLPEATEEIAGHLVLAATVSLMALLSCNSDRRQATLLWSLAVNGTLLSLFGMIQKVTWNGQLFWFLPLSQGGTPFASYVNRNNAAGYLNMTFGAAIAVWLWSTLRDRAGSSHHDRGTGIDSTDWNSDWHNWQAWSPWRSPAAIAMSLLISLGILTTQSRGGIIAFAISVLLLVAAVRGYRGVRVRLIPAFAVMGVVGVAVSTWLSPHATLGERFERLWEDNAEAPYGRLAHWKDSTAAARDYWKFGSGLGTYRHVYRPYERAAFPAWYLHAENQYLETAVEAGIPGILLLCVQIAVVAWSLWRSIARGALGWRWAISLAAGFALATQVLQSATDFGLFLPANMLCLATLIGAHLGASSHCSIAPISGPQGTPHFGSAPPCADDLPTGRLAPRVLWIVTALGFGLLATGLGRRVLSEWDARGFLAQYSFVDATVPPKLPDLRDQARQLRGLHAIRATSPSQLFQLARAAIWDYRLRAAQELSSIQGLEQSWDTTWELTSVSQLHARVHALWREQQSDVLDALRRQPAVVETLMPAYDQLQKAVQNAPLIPKLYLGLAELDLLCRGDPELEVRHLRDAVALAPHDPVLLYRVGLLHLQAGRIDEGVAAWHRSLAASPEFAREILVMGRAFLSLDQLTDRVLPQDPLRVLEIAEKYLRSNSQSDLRSRLADVAESRLRSHSAPEAERLYVRGVCQAIRGDGASAIESIAAAIRLDPQRIAWRYRLAGLYLDHQRFDEAEREALALRELQPRSKAPAILLRKIRAARNG